MHISAKILLVLGLMFGGYGIYAAVSGYSAATGAFDQPIDKLAFWQGTAEDTPKQLGVDVSGSLYYKVARKTEEPAPTNISIVEIDGEDGNDVERFESCTDCETYDGGFTEVGQFLVADNENDIRVTIEGGGTIYLIYPVAGVGAAVGGGLGMLGGVASSCFGLVLLIVGLIIALTVKPDRQADRDVVASD